jgi:hypothetical protein
VPHIRPQSTVDSALAASDAGVPDAENARRHAVAVKTIRRWRRLYQRQALQRGQQHLQAICPVCDGSTLDGAAYAELLGWYLGDGHIVLGRRGVHTLSIFNDVNYPVANARLLDLIRRVKPASRPWTRLRPGCVETKAGWKHWPCLFPQHGPGRKHERPMILADWQDEIVAVYPWDFLRGLMHSDGSRVNNWATRVVRGERRRYDYPRWQFVNASEDILALCTTTLDRVGVPWRRSGKRTVSVSTRAGVAALDEHVGLKT